MPEYHNLQTYARHDSGTFYPYMHWYRYVLWSFGRLDDSVEDWLERSEREVPEYGSVLSRGDIPWLEIKAAGMVLKTRLDLTIFTPEAFPQSPSSWVQFGLLFETEQLQRGSSFSTWEYRQGLGPAIWSLMGAFGPRFPELGVFFTDEAQDGLPLEGYLDGSEKLWRFDLAWIPEENAHLFTPSPDTFFRLETDGALGLAAKGSWKAPPWE